MDNNEIKPIFCGVLEKMDVRWMRLEDGSRCMPYLYSNADTDSNKYRVNNCPSCGKYVDVIELMAKSYRLGSIHTIKNFTKQIKS